MHSNKTRLAPIITKEFASLLVLQTESLRDVIDSKDFNEEFLLDTLMKLMKEFDLSGWSSLPLIQRDLIETLAS